MNVSECMSTDVKVCRPEDSLKDAAQAMKDIDAGVLPVAEGDRLIGMISDRDIAVRAVANGLGPETPIRDAMTGEIRYCYQDEDINEVAANMGDIQVRRLPVLSREKRLVGIISLGDIAKADGANVRDPLGSIATPGGLHHQ